MATIVHKLTTLNSLGQGLLVQLYNVRTFLNDPRVRPEFASPSSVKVAKLITSKFPDFLPNDKIPGLDQLFKGNHQELMTMLEPHYFTFVDVVEFKDLALAILIEAIGEIPEFKPEVNPDLTELFFDLYVTWNQVVRLAAHELEERKLLIGFHTALYAHQHSGAKEASNNKVVAFMKEYSNGSDFGWKRVWEDLKPLSSSVILTLNHMFPSWIKARTTEILRNDGTLSLNANPARLTFPAAGTIYEELLRLPRTTSWYYFGLLGSPEELVNDANHGVLKSVIADTLSIPLYRDFTISSFKEFEELSGYKTKTVSLSKSKKPFKEGFADANDKAARSHRERRNWLRQELFMLNTLLHDTPALLAPKLPLVFAATSMAKEELMWFFRNKHSSHKSKSTNVFFEDPGVPEMIHHILSLQTLIRESKSYLINYYVEYLKGADTIRLDEMINESRFKAATDADVQAVLAWMINWLRTAEPGRHFGDVRQKWAETQTRFIAIARSVPVPIIAPIVDRVQQIMLHTRVVDSFDDLIAEHVSLRALWYFRTDLQQSFERAMNDTALNIGSSTAEADAPGFGTGVTASSSSSLSLGGVYHSLSFLPLAAQSIENATMFDPLEKDRLGQDAVVVSLDHLKVFLDHVIKLLDDMVKLALENETILEDPRTCASLFTNKLNDLTTATTTTKKVERIPTLIPGTETLWTGRTALAGARGNTKHMWQLLSALDEFGSILIYNTLITPREFLVSRIKKYAKSFIERIRYLPPDRSPFKDDQTVIGPVAMIRHLNVLTLCIKQLDSHINIDADVLINQLLLKQVYSGSVGVSGGKLDWISDKGFEYSDNIIKVVAKWYSDFFARRITNSGLNIVYSPNRKGFVTKVVSSGTAGALPLFRAEKYLDIVELTKLASVIGPYGVKIIDREILRFVVSNMSSLLGTLKNLKNDLTELTNGYTQEAISSQVLKNLKPADLDPFIGSSIVIGNALAFRKLLYEALGHATGASIPHMKTTISNAFHQYARNIFLAVEFVGMDSMAQDAGIDVSIADQPLKLALLPLSQSDRALWDLLPAAYACAFLVSTHWKEAIYNPNLEAYENNIHVLLHTVSDLLINFKAIGETNRDEKLIVQQLVKFLDISGTLLLRALASPKLDPKHVPKEFASLFVFLDLFVEGCPLLTRSALEPILPYPLLRSMWRTIFSKVVKGGKAEEGDDAF